MKAPRRHDAYSDIQQQIHTAQVIPVFPSKEFRIFDKDKIVS